MGGGSWVRTPPSTNKKAFSDVPHVEQLEKTLPPPAIPRNMKLRVDVDTSAGVCPGDLLLCISAGPGDRGEFHEVWLALAIG